MPRPVTTPYQEELYATLDPAFTYADESLGWPLLIYCGAIAKMFDQVELYARDQDDGTPGWAIIMDPDLCGAQAPEMLPWLGQFVGVQVDTTLSVADQIAQIKGKDGFHRGTGDSFKAAAQLYLTGSKYVFINERPGGDPYRVSVITLDSETPNPAQVQAALISQKPAGVILDYSHVVGPTYQVDYTAFASYQAMYVHYPRYQDVMTSMP